MPARDGRGRPTLSLPPEAVAARTSPARDSTSARASSRPGSPSRTRASRGYPHPRRGATASTSRSRMTRSPPARSRTRRTTGSRSTSARRCCGCSSRRQPAGREHQPGVRAAGARDVQRERELVAGRRWHAAARYPARHRTGFSRARRRRAACSRSPCRRTARRTTTRRRSRSSSSLRSSCRPQEEGADDGSDGRAARHAPLTTASRRSVAGRRTSSRPRPLPPGIALDTATGAITGAGTTAGRSASTLTVTDQTGAKASVPFSLHRQPLLDFVSARSCRPAGSIASTRPESRSTARTRARRSSRSPAHPAGARAQRDDTPARGHV